MRRGEELADGEARKRIRHDTGSTLFVEAGAGSGKTTALVSRVQTLVLEDRIPIEEIAAVTFTERAAAELRDRLRARLEQAARHERSPEARALVEAALDGLDLAAIGTLHSFAQRILAQHPIEAGIPPLIEVLDEVSSSVAFEGRWTALRSELLDSADMAATLELAFAVGIKLDHVRSLIAKLNSDWDLVQDHIVGGAAPPPPQAPDLSAVVTEARRLVALGDHCSSADDKFLQRLTALAAWADTAELAAGDPSSALGALRDAGTLKWSYGQAANWAGRLAGIKTDCQAWQESARRLVAEVTEASLRAIVHWCGIRVLEAAQARRADGRLEFHDLLVLARNLLAGQRRRARDPAGALSAAAARRVPGHRPDPDRDRDADRRWRRAPRRPTGGRSPCRRGRCSSWATRSSRSTGSGGRTSACTCAPRASSAARSA